MKHKWDRTTPSNKLSCFRCGAIPSTADDNCHAGEVRRVPTPNGRSSVTGRPRRCPMSGDGAAVPVLPAEPTDAMELWIVGMRDKAAELGQEAQWSRYANAAVVLDEYLAGLAAGGPREDGTR